MKGTLISIQEVIEGRVSVTTSEHPDWPCRAGCDECCRRLATIPEITEAEWILLFDVVLHSADISQRILAMDSASRPYTCPMLDQATGRCLTYARRPLACRTYGFYVERDKGLYCGQIHSRVDRGELADVIWGSQSKVDEMSAALGLRRSLVEWFKDYRDKSIPSFFSSSA